MARMIKNTEAQDISCKVITRFSNGTSSTKKISVGDVVEGLRYVANGEVISVTGKVTAITTTISKATKVDTKNPVDYFATDVVVKTITIDASEQYESKIVNVPAKEIVEDEGVTDVVKVEVEPTVRVTMDMAYTDGTIVNQDLEVGDVVTDLVMMAGTPGKPDITGDYKIKAFYYSVNKSVPSITGAYLVPLTGGTAIIGLFKNFISFVETPHADVTSSTSLYAITEALNAAAEGETVYAQLQTDVTVPAREDGRITTTMVNAGKSLNVDLAGHNINCQAYAFYVNGGELVISDSTNGGKIECTYAGKAYPAVFVSADGVCTMEGGTIDTTKVVPSEDKPNWLYGVACSGNGIFNMTGGEMVIGGAAGISITNGTATGEGAKFTIGGDAKITSVGCAAVYLADNKSVDITDNAVINGGMVLRMGDITVSGNAVVNSHTDPEIPAPLGSQIMLSGVDAPEAAILNLTGIYGSSLGNDLNVVVKDNAKVIGHLGTAIETCTINTKYDQKVVIDVTDSSKVTAAEGNEIWHVYDHDGCAELVAEVGKTLPAETNTTDLTIKVDGNVVYPEN